MAKQIIGAHKGADFAGHAFYECHFVECKEPCGLGVKGKAGKEYRPATYCPLKGTKAPWTRIPDRSILRTDQGVR